MKCCNKILKLKTGHSEQKGDYVFFICDVCGKKGIGKDQKNAEIEFKKSKATKTPPPKPPESKQNKSDSMDIALIPKDKRQMLSWASDNMPALMDQSAQFIDKPATKRMINRNIRYISNLSGSAWDKVWKTPEGQESIQHALSEANYYAATLGEMGDLVPYGTTCEYIPNVECFEFALTTGKNAPFSEIIIFTIHENDIRKPMRSEDGDFSVALEMGLPRGKIMGVAVIAKRTSTGKRIGELFDVEHLMEKAERHSASYRQYLMDKEDFQRMKVEGKLEEDETGRSFFSKKIEYTKDGKKQSFIKKTYEHDIINPYDGPDQHKMLIKSAGKTVLGPYMKTRNAAAMATEWSEDDTLTDEMSREEAADNVLNASKKQFENSGPGPVIEAEIIKDGEKEVDETGDDLGDL